MGATTRRFTIADAMILVVAAALATVLARDTLASVKTVYRVKSVDRLLATVTGPATCVAAAVMLALIPIRLRRPRPGLRRLMRQPGFAACCAVAVALSFGALQALSLALFRRAGWGTWPFEQLWAISSGRCPAAITGAWLLLAASGRCRAEPGWIDRLGRGLAALWLAWPLLLLMETWAFRHLPAI